MALRGKKIVGRAGLGLFHSGRNFSILFSVCYHRKRRLRFYGVLREIIIGSVELDMSWESEQNQPQAMKALYHKEIKYKSALFSHDTRQDGIRVIPSKAPPHPYAISISISKIINPPVIQYIQCLQEPSWLDHLPFRINRQASRTPV